MLSSILHNSELIRKIVTVTFNLIGMVSGFSWNIGDLRDVKVDLALRQDDEPELLELLEALLTNGWLCFRHIILQKLKDLFKGVSNLCTTSMCTSPFDMLNQWLEIYAPRPEWRQ